MAPGRRASMRSVRTLPIVHEDEDVTVVTTSEAAAAYPHLQRPYAIGSSPVPNYPYANPACSESSEESGIADRKLEENNPGLNGRLPKRSQNREWFAKRGGWWRLVLTLVLLAAIAVGLGVGLKFGLQKASQDSSDDSGGGGNGNGGASGGNTPSDVFPAGSYTVTVALTNVSTACTTNGFAFGCAPGSHVFSSTGSVASQNASAVTYDWVIAGTVSQSTSGETTTTFSVSSSSTSSSSSPSFSGIHMTLLDAGLSSERLVFTFSMDLAYVPTSDLIAAQTSSATCYFNQTAFQATLWTKQRATFPPTIAAVSAPVNASSTFSPWPYAVEVAEVQQAAPAIPDCVDYYGKSLGNFSVDASGGGNDAVCGCWYSNTVGGASNGTMTTSSSTR
ncbi:hypothetical protein SEUCBS139899_003652 [Sporothrix eucalyptigena]